MVFYQFLRRLTPQMRARVGQMLPGSWVNFGYHKLSDVLIISYPKAGRTWLRYMVGYAISQHAGVTKPLPELTKTFRLTMLLRRGPVVHFSHDDKPSLKHPEEIQTTKRLFKNKRILFLIRDPRDMLVSYYFQALKRSDPVQFEGTLSEFVYHPVGSLVSILKFYNAWANQRHVPKAFMCLRYEDLRTDPVTHLRDVLHFCGYPDIAPAIVEKAVDLFEFQRMQQLEVEGMLGEGEVGFGIEGDRESLKTRKGKVGGYLDYLTPEEIDYINEKINADLDDFYAYYK